MFKYLLLLAIVATFVLAQEQEPVWRQQFSQDFREIFTYPVIGKSTTNGSFYYDFVNKMYAIYRDNGKRDRYCGLNGLYFFYNTPCTQYVSEGIRYIHYPEYNDCCACCDAAHGCGILKPDWLSGAEFIGEVNFEGHAAFKWDKAGLQSNFYYETSNPSASQRIMLGIDQQPNDFQIYDKDSFSTSFDQSKIQLPKECSAQKTCSLVSTCTLVNRA